MKNIFLCSLLIISILLPPNSTWAARALPDNNLSYPVLIILSNQSTGSGFYLNTGNKYYFVTAKHVLFNIPPDKIYKKFQLPKKQILPSSIAKIQYDNYNKKIIFEGQMTKDELNILLRWAKNDTLKIIIKKIYKESQYKLKSPSAKLLSYSPDINNPKQNIITVNFSRLLKSEQLKYSIDHDVAVVEIGKVIENDQKKQIEFLKDAIQVKQNQPGLLSASIDSIKNYNEVLVGNDIYVFGYPTSLGLKNIPQIDYFKPLLRKGIIAGKNDKLKTIIIDCPIYFGNSGGPVVQIENVSFAKKEFRIIGLVSQFVPFVEKIINITHKYKNTNLTNSGYAIVVPMDFILELIESN